MRVRGSSTIAEFDISLFVKPDRRVHCLRSTGIRESTVNALLDRMGVRVDAPIESSSLDAASGGAIPTRARHALSGAVTSVVSRLTRVQPSVQRQRIITVATRTSRNRETLWRSRRNCATHRCVPFNRRGRAVSPRHISGHRLRRATRPTRCSETLAKNRRPRRAFTLI